MLVQALGGGLLKGVLLTQLLEKALLPRQPHLGQGGDGAATQGQPPEGRAQEQVMPLQDAPCRPLMKAGRGLESVLLASPSAMANFMCQYEWATWCMNIWSKIILGVSG